MSKVQYMQQEAISGMWIRPQGKARDSEKAEHTRQYLSAMSWPATPQWGLRRIAEMASDILTGSTS